MAVNPIGENIYSISSPSKNVRGTQTGRNAVTASAGGVAKFSSSVTEKKSTVSRSTKAIYA